MIERQNNELQEALRKQVAAFIAQGRKDASHSLETASFYLGYDTTCRLRAYEQGSIPIPVCELYRMMNLYKRSPDSLLEFSFRIQEIVNSNA